MHATGSADRRASTADVLGVTIVAPGRQSEGGIRSVIMRVLPELEDRQDLDIRWLGTHRTGSAVAKLGCFAGALVRAPFSFARSSVAHVHASVGPSLLRKSVFIWLARLFRCRVILHFHATKTAFTAYFRGSGLLTAWVRGTFRRCDRIVALSESWAPVIREALPGVPVTVIYNPVLKAREAPDATAAQGRRVLYLAHLVERKGYHDLIRAFARVLDEVPDATLVFCGTGDEDRARALCSELGIAASVEFQGWIADDQKEREFSRTAVFCLPSYDEGLPMGILEAMSRHVPIVATPVGGIPDVLEHEGNALLVEPGDVNALGAEIARLLLDPEFGKRLAEQAFEASKAMAPECIAGEWVDLYFDVAGRPAPASTNAAGALNEAMARGPGKGPGKPGKSAPSGSGGAAKS